MRQIKVEIDGTTPLICNKFTDANAINGEKGTSAAFMTTSDKGTPRERAEKKLYVDEKGVIHVPGVNIFRSLIDAGIYHKAGKSKITTQKSSIVPAAMSLEEITCPIINPNGGDSQWEVDSRSVVIPSTGGRIMAHRPRFDRWRLAFTIEYDPGMFAPTLVRTLVDDAGRRVGLGDFRPARKGPFGKFVVTKWAE